MRKPGAKEPTPEFIWVENPYENGYPRGLRSSGFEKFNLRKRIGGSHVLFAVQGRQVMAYCLMNICENFIRVDYVEVARCWRGHHLGQKLLTEVFRKAAALESPDTERSCVEINSFLPDGRKYLKPALPNIEKNFPTVKLCLGW